MNPNQSGCGGPKLSWLNNISWIMRYEAYTGYSLLGTNISLSNTIQLMNNIHDVS